MKLKLPEGYMQDPSDQEIEKDVAELRRLLEGTDAPEDPHPAYWQNFLVHVRGRIDEEQVRRKRRSLITTWASVTAAAAIALFIVNGGIPTTTDDGPARLTQTQSPDATMLADNSLIFTDQGTHSIVLSETDVKMVNAIVKGDDAEVFEAIVDSDMF
jgi:hypothetical protein